MSVGAGYLAKIQRAVRIKTATADTTAELTDLIEMCRADMEGIGVLAVKTQDETDYLILSAVRSYARWKMAADEAEESANMNDYMLQRDELRRRVDYAAYTITFSVTDGTDPIPDAEITFNGYAKFTDATGQAVFRGIDAGTNQAYTAECDGYTTVESDVDVTQSATVSIIMTAG